MEVLAASSVMAAKAEAVVMETMTVSTVAAEAEAVVMETMMLETPVVAHALGASLSTQLATAAGPGVATKAEALREAVPSSLGSQRGSHSLRSRLQSRKARLWNQDHHPHTCRCG